MDLSREPDRIESPPWHKDVLEETEPCEEGGFHGYVKEIPGVHSQGETAKETAKNVLDAIKELLAYRAEKELASRPNSLELDLALVD